MIRWTIASAVATEVDESRWQRATERLGRQFVTGVEDFGYGAALLLESLFWLVLGRWRRQPVRMQAMAKEMMEIGVLAIPVLAILAVANGAMMAMQGIYTYCLTLDPLADRYVSRIFGENGYSIVDNVERLPERLPNVFARLTG